jgi:phosphoglycolate phosphatase-like HAD superfamily hydrolase
VGSEPIRCVIFDFDGVLVDSNAVKRQAYARIFAAVGVPGDLVAAAVRETEDGDRFAVIGAAVHRAQERGLLAGEAPAELIGGLAEAYNAICEEHAATCAEVGGASAVLPRLAGRYALYVASDTAEAPLRRIVQRRGWSRYFRDVLGRPRAKAENIGLIVAREAVEPQAAVVVGDSTRDLRAARHWGCRFIGIRSDASDLDEPGLTLLDDVSAVDTVISGLGREPASC